jgi:hypothetical protein
MMVSALDDVAQRWPREVQMLGVAAKAGLAAQLTGRVERGATHVEATEGAGRWLAAATLYDADTCKWLARVFADALGFDLPPVATEPEAVETSEAVDAGAAAGSSTVAADKLDTAALAGIAPEPPAAAATGGGDEAHPTAPAASVPELDEADVQAAEWAGMSGAAMRSTVDDVGEITVIAPFVGAARAGDGAAAGGAGTEAASATAVAGDEGAASRSATGPELVSGEGDGAGAPPAAAAMSTAGADRAPRTPSGHRGRAWGIAAVILLVLAGGYFVAAHFEGWPPLKKASSSASGNGGGSGSPTITSMTPSAGPNVGGTTVTLQGTDLGGATVTVAGKPVSATCNATSCTFAIPAGSGSAQVRVRNSTGTAATTFVYSSSPASPPAWIAAVFPDVSNNCTPFSADKSLVPGLTSSFNCGDTYLGSTGAVVGFQYDTAADYQAGLNHFNSLYHFSSVTAANCPPSGTAGGQGWWYDSSFPEIQDQSVECLYTSGPSQTDASGKTELFLFPSEDAFVMVWGPSLPWSALQDIWCQNCVGGPASTTTAAGSGNTGSGSGNSSDGMVKAGTPLSATQLLPADVVPGADCKNWSAPHAMSAGLTGTLECSNGDLGGTGTVIAYKYGDASSYATALAALNSSVGFNAATATSSCPPSGNGTGQIEWSNGVRYPRMASQVLECLSARSPVSGGTPGPLYIEAVPTQNAILEFSAPLLSWAELNTWYLSPADGLL